MAERSVWLDEEGRPMQILQRLPDGRMVAHVFYYAQDEDGHWITLDNGQHVFIKEGESVGDAIGRLKGGEIPPKTEFKVSAKLSQKKAEFVRGKVQNLVRRLPFKDTDGIKSVEVRDDLGYHTWENGEETTIGAQYNPVEKTIQLDVSMMDNVEGSAKPCLQHEVGHFVYDEKLTEKQRGDWIDVFYYTKNDESFYGGSTYALHNPGEAFAETYQQHSLAKESDILFGDESSPRINQEVMKTIRGIPTKKIKLFEFESELKWSKIGKSTIDILVGKFKRVNGEEG